MLPGVLLYDVQEGTGCVGERSLAPANEAQLAFDLQLRDGDGNKRA